MTAVLKACAAAVCLTPSALQATLLTCAQCAVAGYPAVLCPANDTQRHLKHTAGGGLVAQEV